MGPNRGMNHWEIMDQKHSFVLDMYIIKPSNQKNYKVMV